MIVNEMAISRSDAIPTCVSLGKKFIEHFVRAVQEGPTSDSFHHHCTEMQSCWDTVKNFKFKHNNKLIDIISLADWFLTAGSDIDKLFENMPTEQNLYEMFVEIILKHRDDINIEETIKYLLV